LPPIDDWERTESTLSCDVGPGVRLLDELQARLVRGPGGSFDSGKIAVQGRVNHELVELWRCAATTTSRHGWHPHGVSVSPLLYALDSHDQLLRSMSLHDVFASATHLLAAQVADYIDHHVPPSHPVGELVLIGPGRKNLALVRELGRRLPVVSFCDAEQLAHDDNVLASSIAALTLLHLWQIPLRPSRGAEIPRILGRLTPGNPANWQGVLRVMNTHAPWLLPLREAI
jgi:1,6-anhydro-N-acetylmuramate kinase